MFTDPTSAPQTTQAPRRRGDNSDGGYPGAQAPYQSPGTGGTAPRASAPTAGTAPAAPAPSGITSGAQSAMNFGNPVYNQIGGYFQQYTGAAPNFGQVSQWGTNVDANYMAKIQQAIYNSQQAQDYRSGANQQTPSTPQAPDYNGYQPGPGGVSAPGQGDWISPILQGLVNNRTVGAPGVKQAQPYTAGQLPTTPLPTYSPYGITQYQGPNQQQDTAQQQALLRTLMANPEVMGPQVVQAMKAQAQDANAAQLQAQLQASQQSAAQRGTTFGGAQGAQEANIRSTAAGQLGQQYGNIDINAALQNWQSKLQALGASDQVQNSILGRAMQNYQTGLAGQQAQAQQNLSGYQSQADAVRYGLERALAQEQANQAQGQQSLAAAGLSQDQYRFNNQQQLAWAQLLNQMLMGRGQLGVDYGQLALQNQLGANPYIFG